MKVGKPRSKRVPVRLRHKIEKASSSKQRKQRKEEKKNPQWRSRLKKDPGIPNLFPYKAKVLAELEEGKRRKEEELQRRKDLAKAQREGKNVKDVQVASAEAVGIDDDEELLGEAEDVEDGEDMEMQDSSNPMAALLASAQARAQNFGPGNDVDLDEDKDGDEEFEGFEETPRPAGGDSTKKSLPKQALADPMKAATALVNRMQTTENGMDALLGHYKIPPLVTAGSDTTTRFLVDVARKRGRLGKGGVPNLHAAALTVLSDLNEQRLKLPAPNHKKGSGNKSEVQIVSQLAEPFKLEGLW
ncbi:hypothetical protein K431DRAFT_190954, partial [Polychaeton citri CBS 116435]